MLHAESPMLNTEFSCILYAKEFLLYFTHWNTTESVFTGKVFVTVYIKTFLIETNAVRDTTWQSADVYHLAKCHS